MNRLERVREALIKSVGATRAARIIKELEAQKKLTGKLRRQIEPAVRAADPQHAQALLDGLAREMSGGGRESYVSDFHGHEVPWSTDDH